MQNWAKRGLQTALVTGGLLMLGTGIASAEENVSPDRPASPLDGSITVPVDIGNNAVGTPNGQYDAPEHQGEYSSRQITDPAKAALESAAAQSPASGQADAGAAQVTDAVSQVTEAAAPVTEAAAPATGRAGVAEESDDPFRGNKGSLDVVVPIQIANNALALFGPAEVSGGDHQQSYDGSSDVTTDGAGESLGGNVVDVDWAAPVQIANNAAGIGSDASSTGNNASQTTTQGGADTTDGSGGVLAGNIIAPAGATPVQVNNNAAAGGGTAESSGNTSSSDAATGGPLQTDGSDGVGAGNVAGVPVALPVELNNGAYSLLGIADSSGNGNTAAATAGGTTPGMNNIPAYAQTNGDDGVASGNIAQPQAAGDAAVHGVAATAGGIANSGAAGGGGSRSGSGTNTNETDSKAGGFSSTSGEDSVLGGNLADAPVAAPVEAFCVAGSLVGKASSDCENDTTADAGGGTFTDATGSVIGGNSAHTPVGTTVEAFGVGGTAVGTADSTATEDKTVDAGGYNGSRGDDSVVGGNIVQTPVAAPVESFGLGGAAAGDASGTASETKDVNSGGDGNTEDDDGTISSNVIATPIAQPVQVFGIGGSLVGSGNGHGTSETETESGGDYTGSGHGAAGSGNIVQAASSAPAQVFGIGAVGGGDASGTGDNTSSSTAGGESTTDGSDGELSGNVAGVANSLPAQVHGIGGAAAGDGMGTSTNVTDSAAGGDTATDGTGSSTGGNVVSAPIAGAAGVFGNAGSLAGNAAGDGTNDVVSTGGGSTETAGDDGSLAGNVISAQALPIAQIFGNGATIGGFADGVGDSTTDATSGGDVTTSGDSGSLSGNIFDLPAAVVAQIFGDALAVGGDATGTGDNTTVGTAGGVAESTDGQVGQVPVGALVQVFNFSGPLLGEAMGAGTNVTDISVGNELPQLDLVMDGSEMAIDGLPSLDGLQQAPASPLAMERTERPDVTPALQPKPVPSAPATAVAMPLPAPAAPALPELPALTELPTLPVFGDRPVNTLPAPAAPEVAQTLPAPAAPEVAQTLPAPAAPEVAQTLPAPAAPDATHGLPTAPGMVHTMPASKSGVQEAGLRGLWAKFTGFLTNEPMHIEG